MVALQLWVLAVGGSNPPSPTRLGLDRALGAARGYRVNSGRFMQICGCSSMARAPAFQAGDAGSTPVTRSRYQRSPTTPTWRTDSFEPCSQRWSCSCWARRLSPRSCRVMMTTPMSPATTPPLRRRQPLASTVVAPRRNPMRRRPPHSQPATGLKRGRARARALPRAALRAEEAASPPTVPARSPAVRLGSPTPGPKRCSPRPPRWRLSPYLSPGSFAAPGR